MAFLEQFTSSDLEGSRTALQEQINCLNTRLSLVDTEELVPAEWVDEELAAELGIQLEPKWKEVEVSLPGGARTLQIARVVTPWLHTEAGEEVGRHLTIIGKPADAKDGEYAEIGTMYAGRYEGDTAYLVLHNGPDPRVENYVSWESVDAALFIKLAEQILPDVAS